MRHNVRMEPKDRLREARINAGYKTPTDAARALKELNQNTLISNENGNRPISRKAAAKYGELFGVDPGWILFGDDQEAPQKITDLKQVEAMLLRVDGLNKSNVDTIMAIISNSIKANAYEQEHTRTGDQSASSSHHHELTPENQQ
nr:helix-turn-helix transcriptional regulator [Brucella sp. HL-2]